MITADNFLQVLDQKIQKKHLLLNPFYIAWSEGKLSKECLKEYAKEYYFHVKAFPTYLSALHAHTEDSATRKELLQNLIEEEAGRPNHPELFKDFAISLGATEDELDNMEPSEAIKKLVQSFRTICKEGSVSDGIASLYAYESQIPAICISKIDGLKKFYGMTNPDAWKYFSIHIQADVEHANVERELLKKHIAKDEPNQALEAVDCVLDCLNGFLTHMCHRYNISCAA